MINWKLRVRSKAFWVGVAGVVVSPVLAYYGAKPEDLTTWKSVGQLVVETVKNPYLVGSIGFGLAGFLGVITDPTTAGVADSDRALTYIAPGVTAAELTDIEFKEPEDLEEYEYEEMEDEEVEQYE